MKASGSASIEILGAELAGVFRLRMLPIIVGRFPPHPQRCAAALSTS